MGVNVGQHGLRQPDANEVVGLLRGLFAAFWKLLAKSKHSVARYVIYGFLVTYIRLSSTFINNKLSLFHVLALHLIIHERLWIVRKFCRDTMKILAYESKAFKIVNIRIVSPQNKRSVGYSLSAMQNYKELTDNVSHATLILNILQPETLTLILHLILLTPLWDSIIWNAT
jgi:hypothetical protein